MQMRKIDIINLIFMIIDIIFVTKCYYTCDLYYICDQFLLHLWPLLSL